MYNPHLALSLSFGAALQRLPCATVMTTSLLLVWASVLAGCGSAPTIRSMPASSSSSDASGSREPAQASALSVTLQKLANEAKSVEPLATSELGKRFLNATSSLPAIEPRTVFQNPQTREYFSPAETVALTDAVRSKLVKTDLDEYRYYYTKYGSPLAYLRPLDIASANGLSDIAGKRILDYGYGSIGHLRLMASLGAHMTGIDPDSYLDALYSDARDQGEIPAAGRKLWRGRPGTITLVHSAYPKDAKAIEKVGQGYDLILSKNTLKRGYLKPERKADKRQLIDLGVSDEVFLKTLFAALNPGGKLLIYNLYPKAAASNEAYKPLADGRSPFSRAQYEKAGFQVLALDREDHVAARLMGRALKWDQNDKGETIDDLDTNLFAMFTLVGKPLR